MSENEVSLATEQDQTGLVRISDDVVSTIAGLAAMQIEGVTGMSGGIVGGIAEILGAKNLSKGVKVEVGEKEAAVDLFVIVQYGVQIPEIAEKIQTSVKEAVQKMTGLEVVEVNVHIQGVTFPEDEKEDEGRVR